jgi:hypothetical protein
VSGATRKAAERRFLTPAQLRAAAFAYEHFLNKRFKFPLARRRCEASVFDVTEARRGPVVDGTEVSVG